MTAPTSPRQYSDAELAAAKRLGAGGMSRGSQSGPIFFASGDWWPKHIADLAQQARQRAADAELVHAAMLREWPRTTT